MGHQIDLRIPEFNNPPTIETDNMVMLFIPIGLFELHYFFAKMMFDNKSAFIQKLEGVIDSGPADQKILFLKPMYKDSASK